MSDFNQEANVGAVALTLADIAGGAVLKNNAEQGAVIIGFQNQERGEGYVVEVCVAVGGFFGGPDQIQITTDWVSRGNTSMSMMRLALARAENYIQSLKTWGFELEVEVL